MKSNLLFIIFSALVLVFLNYAIYEKEALKKEGELVYLELAPVDPRSLMQGDFMQLRFDVVSLVPSSQIKNWPSRGFMAVALNEDNIGIAPRLYEGGELPETVKLFRYAFQARGGLLESFFGSRFGQISIVPNTYFFQEGQARLYAQARYGVFIFGKGGDYLLVGLADENRKLIEPPTASNFD